MLSLFPINHHLHNPEHEIFRGERVPAFEKPERAEFVLEALTQARHEIRTDFQDSSRILTQVHSPRYIEFIQTAWQQWLALDPNNVNEQVFPSVWPVPGLSKNKEPDNFVAKLGYYSMDNGTPMVAGTWEVVKAGADAAYTAAHLVNDGLDSVLCALRPPGHHAGSDFMGGYCFINNAAVAAQTLRDLGCDRVSILDVDYHHGNGTQQIFYQRSDVQVLNLHADPRFEYPFFLGHADENGEGQGEGFNHNYPLPAGTKAEQWFAALENASQKIGTYKPDALIVSLGLDTYENDPLSSFHISSQDFIRLGQKIRDIGLPTIFILEGGYASSDLGMNVVNVIKGYNNLQ